MIPKAIEAVLTLCLLSLAFAGNFDQLRQEMSPTEKEFSGLFVLRWPAAFCEYLSLKNNGVCQAQKLALWDSLSFTIEGLWMNKKSPEPSPDYSQHEMNLNKGLGDRLLNYWPCFFKPLPSGLTAQYALSSNLWRRQWNSHGKDYAYALERLYPEEFHFDRQKLQQTYFDDALKLYERRFYELKKIVKSSIMHPEQNFLLEKTQIANLLGLKQNQFHLLCVPATNYLFQIQICLKIDEDGTWFVDCQQVSQGVEETCPWRVELFKYGINRDTVSGRVTEYEEVEMDLGEEF